MGLFSSAAKRCSNGKKFLRSAGACYCSPSACAPAGGVRGKEEASTSAPASVPADSKKKRWRNRTFWRKKRKANKESGDGSGELADLVNNISAKSGKPIHPTATRTHADADAHMRAWLIRLPVRAALQMSARM